MYEKVKHFYDLGLYSKEQVGRFVIKGKITTEEYKIITGNEWEDYNNEVD